MPGFRIDKAANRHFMAIQGFMSRIGSLMAFHAAAGCRYADSTEADDAIPSCSVLGRAPPGRHDLARHAVSRSGETSSATWSLQTGRFWLRAHDCRQNLDRYRRAAAFGDHKRQRLINGKAAT